MRGTVRHAVRALVLAGAVAAATAVAPATAAQASFNGHCVYQWFSEKSYQVQCQVTNNTEFRAKATCYSYGSQPDRIVYGPWRSLSTEWSKVTCPVGFYVGIADVAHN